MCAGLFLTQRSGIPHIPVRRGMSSWPVILAAVTADLVPADLALNECALMRAWWRDEGDERITLAVTKDNRAVVGDESFEFLVHGGGVGMMLIPQSCLKQRCRPSSASFSLISVRDFLPIPDSLKS